MSELYKRFSVSANIIFGNIELVGGTPFGKLAVTFNGRDEDEKKALAYIREQGVRIEEIKLS